MQQKGLRRLIFLIILKKSEVSLHTIALETVTILNLNQKTPTHETRIARPHWFSTELCVEKLRM